MTGAKYWLRIATVLTLGGLLVAGCSRQLGTGDPPETCDDGSPLMCRMVEPDCEAGLQVAIQEGCYRCVDPWICTPPTDEPCAVDEECAWNQYCEPCAAASCPECTDCVAACWPRTATLHLYVSNQSFDIDPVHIRVRLDGEIVVDDDFSVGMQHNWFYYPLLLEPGTYALEIDSITSEATFTQELVIEDEHWAVIDFWYYPPSHYSPTEEQFTFELSDDPIYFM
ncbi:MAG: hypothetical protein ABI333_19160 [bacterium]